VLPHRQELGAVAVTLTRTCRSALTAFEDGA
jgi:hypothetical protein